MTLYYIPFTLFRQPLRQVCPLPVLFFPAFASLFSAFCAGRVYVFYTLLCITIRNQVSGRFFAPLYIYQRFKPCSPV